MNNDKIQVSFSVNATKTLLVLATQQIDLLTTDNIRLMHRVQELTDQCNELHNKLHERDQHLNVGPSYEQIENALLTEQEHNDNLTKEVDRLTAILQKRDAEIAKLREVPSDVDTEEPNREAYHDMGDPQTVEAPVEAVAPGHCCGACRHAVATDNSGIIHCCLREADYSAHSLGCGSFNSKHARKKRLPEE